MINELVFETKRPVTPSLRNLPPSPNKDSFQWNAVSDKEATRHAVEAEGHTWIQGEQESGAPANFTGKRLLFRENGDYITDEEEDEEEDEELAAENVADEDSKVGVQLKGSRMFDNSGFNSPNNGGSMYFGTSPEAVGSSNLLPSFATTVYDEDDKNCTVGSASFSMNKSDSSASFADKNSLYDTETLPVDSIRKIPVINSEGEEEEPSSLNLSVSPSKSPRSAGGGSPSPMRPKKPSPYKDGSFALLSPRKGLGTSQSTNLSTSEAHHLRFDANAFTPPSSPKKVVSPPSSSGKSSGSNRLGDMPSPYREGTFMINRIFGKIGNGDDKEISPLKSGCHQRLRFDSSDDEELISDALNDFVIMDGYINNGRPGNNAEANGGGAHPVSEPSPLSAAESNALTGHILPQATASSSSSKTRPFSPPLLTPSVKRALFGEDVAISGKGEAGDQGAGGAKAMETPMGHQKTTGTHIKLGYEENSSSMAATPRTACPPAVEQALSADPVNPGKTAANMSTPGGNSFQETDVSLVSNSTMNQSVGSTAAETYVAQGTNEAEDKDGNYFYFGTGKLVEDIPNASENLVEWQNCVTVTGKTRHQRVFPDAKSGVKVVVNGEEIALFRVDGSVYAMQTQCPHRKGPIHMGDIEDMAKHGPCVVCPWHKWTFKLESGALVKPDNRSGNLKVYPVKIKGLEIFVGFGNFSANAFKGEGEEFDF